MQLSGINIPEEHNKHKALQIRFRFFVLEELIVRENAFQISNMTDYIVFGVFPFIFAEPFGTQKECI